MKSVQPKPLFKSVQKGWTPDELGDQSGKTMLITGGNSGIGLEAARILAGKGADIILCARSQNKGERAVAEINAMGRGQATLVILDLADMASIRAAADVVADQTSQLDALINNAGIMQTPKSQTVDGFDLQFGTNHLGHFLLNGLLFPLVEVAQGRIVTVSSIAHKFGYLKLRDLNYQKGRYNPSIAYAQSKLANIMYAFELQRRLDAAKSSVTSYAVHPGYSNTALQSTGPGRLLTAIYKPMNKLFAQPAEYGAWPTVLAAAEPKARPGGYYGPTGWQDSRGPVGDAAVHPRALNRSRAAKLWAKSEEMVGFDWSSVLDRSKNS